MQTEIQKQPCLYKRAKTGDIQYWQIQVDDTTIIKQSGKLGTKKPIIHREVISTGKNIGKSNETTPRAQALMQMASDWARKRDEGYKSLVDLGIMEYGDYVSKDGQDLSLAEMLQVQLPQFNTDANLNLKPMLAPTKGWKKGDKKNKYPKFAEPKLDGVRSTIIIDGLDINILSRSGKPYDTLQHIVAALKRGIAKGAFLKTGKVILDGEIYLHGLLLEEINEAVKKPNDNTPKLQFWCYDVPSKNGNQQERSYEMLSLVADINEPEICFTVQYGVNNDDDVEKLHNDWVEKGFEGAMLKDPAGTYQPGQRSSYWTKVKMFDDSEFAFKNFEFGQRGVEDLVAVCWVDVNGQLEEFRAKMQGTLEMKEKLYQRDDLEGRSLTVKHFGYSKYGIPNLPTGKAFKLLKDVDSK